MLLYFSRARKGSNSSVKFDINQRILSVVQEEIKTLGLFVVVVDKKEYYYYFIYLFIFLGNPYHTVLYGVCVFSDQK